MRLPPAAVGWPEVRSWVPQAASPPSSAGGGGRPYGGEEEGERVRAALPASGAGPFLVAIRAQDVPTASRGTSAGFPSR